MQEENTYKYWISITHPTIINNSPGSHIQESRSIAIWLKIDNSFFSDIAFILSLFKYLLYL